MSTSRGNSTRKRPQKHQNKTAFKNDLHDTSRKTKVINSLEVSGVCTRCRDIIQWKIKYKKYKPLSMPAKCVGCSEKAVKHAYHMLCNKCAAEKKVCAKCCKLVENDEQHESTTTPDLQTLLKGLPERKRRTILRHINTKSNGELTSEVNSFVEELLCKMDSTKISDDDDYNFSDDDISEKSNKEE